MYVCMYVCVRERERTLAHECVCTSKQVSERVRERIRAYQDKKKERKKKRKKKKKINNMKKIKIRRRMRR